MAKKIMALVMAIALVVCFAVSASAEILVTPVTEYVNGDAKVTSADYIKIRKHIMKTEVISNNVYFAAADANQDGKVTSADYVKIRKIIMGG